MPKDRSVSSANDEDITRYGIKYSLFLNNLEQWIDEIISRDGLAKGDLIKMVNDSFARAMQANIEHYRFMAINAKENGERSMTDRYSLMAEIYQSLLPKR